MWGYTRELSRVDRGAQAAEARRAGYVMARQANLVALGMNAMDKIEQVDNYRHEMTERNPRLAREFYRIQDECFIGLINDLAWYRGRSY